MKTAKYWDKIWLEKVAELIALEATKQEIDAAALDHVRAIQKDARQSTAREAARVVEPWDIHGYSEGVGKLFTYPSKAILAHFKLEDGK